MKKIVLFIFTIAVIFNCKSQTIAPQSLNSGGKGLQVNNVLLDFTIGELVVISQTDNEGNTINGGFTAGASLSTLTLIETNAEIIQVSVFPNPTSSLLTVQIQNSQIDQFQLSLIDGNGKEVFCGKYNKIAQYINMNLEDFPSGNYFLNLKDTSSEILGTYKIIKQ